MFYDIDYAYIIYSYIIIDICICWDMFSKYLTI